MADRICKYLQIVFSMLSRLTSAFGWDAQAQRFRASNGRFVTRDVVDAATETAVESATSRMADTSRQLQRGEVDLRAWHDSMRDAIKDAHAASAALGAGGWDQWTRDDWQWLGSPDQVGFHLDRLRAFADDIANGRYRSDLSDPRFLQRAQMFGRASRTTRESARHRKHRQRGFKWARRVLGAAEHCADCRAFAARGWVRIEDVVPIGRSACGSNCHCWIEYSDTALDEAALQDEALAGREPTQLERLRIKTTIDLSIRKSQGKTREQVVSTMQDAIRDQRFEVGVIISRRGEVLHTEIGRQYRVIIPESKTPLLKGSILLHNHPRGLEFEKTNANSWGKSFSIEDINAAINNDVAEIIAVTPRRSFSMRPGRASWKQFSENLDEDLREAVKIVYAYEVEKIYDQKMSPEEQEADHLHRIWIYLTRKRGMIYSMEKRDDL